jgi:enoyl-CoA hydratase/carnithine racemase
MPLDESLKLERQMTDRIRETEDFIEGPKAFREKRKPNWKGK